MSACKGETADLDLTGTLPLNFLPWIKFLKRHFGFCWLPWWFFPTWRANIERQIPSGIPAPLRGEVMRSTPQFLQLHLQDKPKAVFCLAAFGTSIIQCPCQPAACLGGLLTNTAYLKHLFFFLSDQFYQLPYWFYGSLRCPYWEQCCSTDLFGCVPIPGFRITLLREWPSVSPAASSTLDK